MEGTLRSGIISEAIGEAINIASETETKIIDLANMINELTENKAGIIFKERRSWDKAIRRRASIEKARKILGYETKTGMKTGLQKTINWFNENSEHIKSSANF